MSNLLNNVGGIDSTLFHKPQSMRDLRAKHTTTSPSAERPSAKIDVQTRSQTQHDDWTNLKKQAIPTSHTSADRGVAANHSQTDPLSDIFGGKLDLQPQLQRCSQITKQ